MVRGWWSAISQLLNINLLWSGVGGQLLVNYWTSTSCHQLLVVNFLNINFLSSTSCGHLWTRSLKEPFGCAFGSRSRRPLLLNQMVNRLPLLQAGSRTQVMSLYVICWKYSNIIKNLKWSRMIYSRYISPKGRNSRALRRLRILETFEPARVQLFQTIIALIIVDWILNRQRKLYKSK